MAKVTQLKLVLEIESKKEQMCARNHQEAKAHVLNNQQKLSGLERYRLDYLHSIRSKAQQGIDAMTMSQHHQFVAKLDKACEQQVQLINQAVLVADQRKKQWLDQQQKLKAIKTLIDIKLKKESVKQAKIEQKMFDEFACRQAFKPSRS